MGLDVALSLGIANYRAISICPYREYPYPYVAPYSLRSRYHGWDTDRCLELARSRGGGTGRVIPSSPAPAPPARPARGDCGITRSRSYPPGGQAASRGVARPPSPLTSVPCALPE